MQREKKEEETSKEEKKIEEGIAEEVKKEDVPKKESSKEEKISKVEKKEEIGKKEKKKEAVFEEEGRSKEKKETKILPTPEAPKEKDISPVPVPAAPKDEKIYTIPLRKAFRKAERKRAPYAIRLVRDFLQTHTKTQDIKLGKHLNEKMREKRNPPRRVRVKVVKDEGVIKAELMGFDYVDFKAKPKTEKKGIKDKLLGRLGPKALKKQEEDEKVKVEKKPEEAPKVVVTEKQSS